MIAMTPVMRTCLHMVRQYSRTAHEYRSVHASRMGMASGAGLHDIIPGVCMWGLSRVRGVFCVLICCVLVHAFPIGRARSDQQLASSETHSRAPAGCVLALLIFVLMACVWDFWFPPRWHAGCMPTCRKTRQTCACAWAMGLRPEPGSATGH